MSQNLKLIHTVCILSKKILKRNYHTYFQTHNKCMYCINDVIDKLKPHNLVTNLVALGVFTLSPQGCQIQSKIDIYFKGILGALVQNFAVTIHLLKI